MQVVGVRDARNTGRRGTPVIRAAGYARDAGQRGTPALRAGGDRFVARGGWHRVASRAGWRRVAGELTLVAVLLLVYEEIRWHMVQAGGAAASHALSVVS